MIRRLSTTDSACITMHPGQCITPNLCLRPQPDCGETVCDEIMKIEEIGTFLLQPEQEPSITSKYFNSPKPFWDHYFRYFAERSEIPSWIRAKRWRRVNTVYDLTLLRETITHYIEPLEDLFQTRLNKCMLVVALERTNGHAICLNSEFVPWFDVLMFKGNKATATMQQFIPHELAHALHYTLNPEMYFFSEIDLWDYRRLLISEGLALAVCQQLNQSSAVDTIWGDYLNDRDKESWLQLCADHRAQHLEYLQNNLMRHDPLKNLFGFLRLADPYGSKTGYLIAMEFCKTLLEEYSVPLVAQLSREKVRKYFLHWVEQQA